MGQTAYSLYTGQGFAGLLADAVDDLVESAVAFEAINFGRGLMAYAGETDVEMALRDVATLTYAGTFVASNVFGMTINGSSVAPVTFSTTSTAMETALLSAIQACSAVSSASKDGTGMIFTVRTKGTATTIVPTISGGATVECTATVEIINATAAKAVFKGISVQRNTEGTGYIKTNEIVDVLRKGRIWVDCTTSTAESAPAYVDMADGTGKFTTLSTNNLATGGVFKMNTTAPGLSVVEINLP